MVGKDVDHLKRVLLATTCRNSVSEHRLFLEVVHEWREHKLRILGISNGPAGEAARDGNHIILRIAAVDTERVQFHDLPAIIFVQTMRDSSQWSGQDRVGNT